MPESSPQPALDAAPHRGAGAGWLRRLGPWLLATTLLGWLFYRAPTHELRLAIGRVPLAAFVALSIGYAVVVLAADSAAVLAAFRYSLPGVPLRYLEVLRIRGASLPLAIVNYGVGQGGVAWFLSRRHGVPGALSAGAVLLNFGVSVLLVALSAGLGMAFGGAPGSPALTLVIAALAAGFPVYLVVIALRPSWLARHRIVRPLFDAGLRGHLVGLAARLPHMAVLLAGNYLAMRAFGIHPPVWQAIALLPVVFVIGVLPISPSGLGTTQVATVTLFAPFAPGVALAERQATTLAYSVSFQFAVLIIQAVIGLAFLQWVSRTATVSSHG